MRSLDDAVLARVQKMARGLDIPVRGRIDLTLDVMDGLRPALSKS